MADINSTQNITLWNELGTNKVEVGTDSALQTKSKLWDGTDEVGVTNNRLNVNAALVVTGEGTVNILRSAEFTLTSRNEQDVAGVTFTVPAGETFALIHFAVTGDSPGMIKFRLKVDGVTKFVINLGPGQGATSDSFTIPVPLVIATENQVVKITVEPNYKNGTGWAEFSGGTF